MAQQDTPFDFSTLNIPADPLADFQAKMDELIAQADANLEQAETNALSQSQSQPSPSSPNPHATCPGRYLLSNTHWYGWPTCTICPSCYTTFAQPTPLAPLMPLHNYFIPAPTLCDMYSPRQRTLYLTACSTGDISSLLSVTEARSAIWHETIGLILQKQSERDILLAKAEIMRVSANHNALIEGYNAMGSLDDNDEERRRMKWRTDTGGLYSSWNGVVAERERIEADELGEAAGEVEVEMDESELRVLEGRWEEVE